MAVFDLIEDAGVLVGVGSGEAQKIDLRLPIGGEGHLRTFPLEGKHALGRFDYIKKVLS